MTTVAELIKQLQKLPQDSYVALCDSKVNWPISITEVHPNLELSASLIKLLVLKMISDDKQIKEDFVIEIESSSKECPTPHPGFTKGDLKLESYSVINYVLIEPPKENMDLYYIR